MQDGKVWKICAERTFDMKQNKSFEASTFFENDPAQYAWSSYSKPRITWEVDASLLEIFSVNAIISATIDVSDRAERLWIITKSTKDMEEYKKKAVEVSEEIAINT